MANAGNRFGDWRLLADSRRAMPVRPELVALIAAGGLFGFGLIVWVAANWFAFGTFARFGLVGAAVVLAGVGTAIPWRLRLPGALVGVLATGGMLALYGQTYQTGIDPWPLFATWAALSVPWALALRHDAVWCLVVLIAAAALQLWFATQLIATEGAGLAMFAAWGMGIAAAWLLSPWAGVSRWLGETGWAFRLAAVSTIVMVGRTAVMAVFWPTPPPDFAPLMGLVVLVGSVALFASATPIYRFLLSLSVMSVAVLLIALVWKSIWQAPGTDVLFLSLFSGLTAAGITAGAGVLIARLLAWRGTTMRGAAAPLWRVISRGATAPRSDASPTVDDAALGASGWPIAIVSSIGAALAAVPLIIYLTIAFGPQFITGAGAFVVGAIAIAFGLWLIRQTASLGFRQQFGFISLTLGMALVSFGLMRHVALLPANVMAFAMFAGVAALVPVRWMSLVFGLGAVTWALGIIAGVSTLVNRGELAVSALSALQWQLMSTGYPIVFLGAAAALILLAATRAGATASAGPVGDTLQRFDGFVSGFAAGVLIKAMAGSPTFLGGGVGWVGRGMFTGTLPFDLAPDIGRLLAVSCVIGAIALAAWRLRVSLTTARLALIAVVTVLAYVMPMLALPLMILAAAWISDRRVMALLAGLAAIWVMGSFYYWLGMPLHTKGLLLMALGLALGAALALRADDAVVERGADDADATPPSMFWWPAACVVVSVVALAALIGAGVVRSEAVLAHGRRVLVELAPVDPRSLLQGDYMALNFRMPTDALPAGKTAEMPGWAIATVSQAGVAEIVSFADRPTAADGNQIAMRVWFRGRRPVLGTSGYYFAEGQAKTFEAARYGIFRVGDNGRVILTGLADEALRPLGE